MYTYAASATPTLRSLSQQRAVAGDNITLELLGLSDVEDDNVLVFGSTNIPCSSPSPRILSTSRTRPSRDTATVARTYSNYTVECVLPNLAAGKYRPVLHVAGRGWGYSYLEDTVLTIYPQITSAPSIVSGSLRGGTSTTMSTRGLSPDDVLRTRVKIGSTPCRVEDIDSQGVLTCFTQAAVDDGYSSLVEASAPLAYWSLQTDYHRSNGSYLDSDGISFFRSTGSLGTLANASVRGVVSLQQSGISGNNFTDQSIRFDEAAFLHIPDLEELFDPTGFALEFWVKVPHSTPHYRLLVDAASSCETDGCGFVVVLNPCNQIEFWVASREPLNEAAESGDSQDGSRGLEDISASAHGGSTGGLYGSGENEGGLNDISVSGGRLDGDTEEGNLEVCALITATSHCHLSRPCSGYLRVTEQRSLRLPAGVWHVIRSNQFDVSDWNHVYMSWHNSERGCTASDLCNGTQQLVVNEEHQSIFSTYLGANGGIDLGGSSSVPLATGGIWSGLAPFTGYLDEVAYYNRPLRSQEISDRVRHIVRQSQLVWLEVEGFDGMGEGSTPSIVYLATDPPLNPVIIDWETAIQSNRILENLTMLQFQWTA